MNRGAAGHCRPYYSLPCSPRCGSDDGGRASDPAASETPPELPQSDEPFKLDPAELGPDVTNPWFPLEPGTRWTYREVDEDGEVLEVVVTATPETRMIANGVEARVVRDTVTLDGEIVEDTFDWYAQDTLGRSGTSARTPPSSRTATSRPTKARSRPASTTRWPA